MFSKFQEFQNTELKYRDIQVLNFYKTMTTQFLLTKSSVNTKHGHLYISSTSQKQQYNGFRQILEMLILFSKLLYLLDALRHDRKAEEGLKQCINLLKPLKKYTSTP